jgi:hypothetical protein
VVFGGGCGRSSGRAVASAQVYTVARAPSDPRVGALTQERLLAIAASARAAGLDAAVYA